MKTKLDGRVFGKIYSSAESESLLLERSIKSANPGTKSEFFGYGVPHAVH